MSQGYLGLPVNPAPRDVSRVVNSLLQGRSNNTGTFTLAADNIHTLVQDSRVGPGTVVVFTPITASAAAAVPTTFVSERDKQVFTLEHTADPAVDRTFAYAVIG